MIKIEHPYIFRTGTRVMMLKGRNKDGNTYQRCIMRATHDAGAFNRAFAELENMALPGERIYASATERNMTAAVRLFKQRQLDNDYDEHPMEFYRKLNSRWCSILSNPKCESKPKTWLWDCDNDDEYLDAKFVIE